MAGADAQGATMKSSLPFLPALLACLTMPAIAASFDCGQARTPVERAICTDPSLSAQDEQLALLFEQAKLHGERSEVIRQQKSWLKTRDACKDLTCLRKQYKSQVQLLQPVAAAIGQGMPWTGRYIVNRDNELAIRQIGPKQIEFDFMGCGYSASGTISCNGVHGVARVQGSRGHFSAEDCNLQFYRHEDGSMSVDQQGICDLGAYVTMGNQYRRVSKAVPTFPYKSVLDGM